MSCSCCDILIHSNRQKNQLHGNECLTPYSHSFNTFHDLLTGSDSHSFNTFHDLLTGSDSIVMAASSSSDVPMTESDQKTGMEEKLPICMVVLGMAGSGKTTLVQVRFDSFDILFSTHSHRTAIDKLPVQEQSTSLCDQLGPSVSGSSLSCQC